MTKTELPNTEEKRMELTINESINEDINSEPIKDIKEPYHEEKLKLQDNTKNLRILYTLRQRDNWHDFHVLSPPLDIDIKMGDWVKVEMDGRVEVAKVVQRPFRIDCPKSSAIKILGLATEEDMKKYRENLEKEERARDLCLQFNEELGITKMDLTRVESFMDGSKIIFYYYSEGRIDFRELVKQLVKTLKSRVEMRQIGIRHEAKMIGGAAHCGREMCCSLFLDNFKPITLKMARDQNLIPNPSKLSGRCGRLLCCLRYELDESYQDVGIEDEVVDLSGTDDNIEILQKESPLMNKMEKETLDEKQHEE